MPAHRPQSSCGRDARDLEHGHRLSQHARRDSPIGGDAGRDSARSRSRDLRGRQMASGADGGMHGGWTAAQLAAAARLRSVLRLSAGRDRSVLSGADLRQSLRRYAGHGGGGLSPVGGHRRAIDGFYSRLEVIGARASVFSVPRFRRDAFAPSVAAKLSREVSRTVRCGLGRGARRMVRPSERIRNRAQRYAARAAQSGRQAVVSAIGEGTNIRRAPAGGVRRDAEITPMRKSADSPHFSSN